MIAIGFIWAKIKAYVIGAVVVIGALMAAFFSGRREGKALAQKDQLEGTLDSLQRGNEAAAQYKGNGGAVDALEKGKF
jgi:hypothetical protein